MVCPYCASNNIITIKGVGFCVNCGRSLSGPSQAETAARQGLPKAASPPKSIAVTTSAPKIQIKSRHQIASPSSTVAAAAPRRRHISDISRPQSATKVARSAGKQPDKPMLKSPLVPLRPQPTVHTSRDRTTNQTKPVTKPLKRSTIMTTSSVLSGLLGAAIAVNSYLVLHISHVTSVGGFFHYLATRSSHTKLLLAALTPTALVVGLGLITLWLWQRSSTIYAASRLYDHRPANRQAASRAGFNALGSVVAISLLGLLAAVVWLAGLIGVIKSLNSLSLGYWQMASLGVAVSFVMVLMGLWLAAGFILAGYAIVLSGQKLIKSLGDGLHLASRDYVNVAGVALAMSLTLAILVTLIVAAVVGLSLDKHHLSAVLIATLGGLLAALMLGWYSQFALNHWVRRYRLSVVKVYSPDKAMPYLAGRHPKPVSKLGVSIVIIWWLAVAIGGGYWLWQAKVDPSGLLNSLSANIY